MFCGKLVKQFVLVEDNALKRFKTHQSDLDHNLYKNPT